MPSSKRRNRRHATPYMDQISRLINTHADLAEYRDKSPPPSSTGRTTGGISSFSDDDEDWLKARESQAVMESLLSVKDSSASPKTHGESQEEKDVGVADEVMEDEGEDLVDVKEEISLPAVPAIAPNAQSELHSQASTLQQLLFSFSQNLSGITGQTTSSFNDEARLSFFEREYPHLRTLNEALQNANTRLRAQVTELKAQLHETQEGKAWKAWKKELQRSDIGIDPEKIQELAIDLSIGARDANDVADALFGLIDKATPYPTGPEEANREKLAPRERLRNLEGVVDVSLGRMETLENRVDMLIHPDRKGKGIKLDLSIPMVDTISGMSVTDGTADGPSITSGSVSGVPAVGAGRLGLVDYPDGDDDDGTATENGKSVMMVDSLQVATNGTVIDTLGSQLRGKVIATVE